MTTLHQLAALLGVATRYRDGLGNLVDVADDTLVRVCAALGAPMSGIDDANTALKAVTQSASRPPAVLVAWDGVLPSPGDGQAPATALLHLESGETIAWSDAAANAPPRGHLPFGYHRLTLADEGATSDRLVISAPRQAWHRDGARHGWGVATHLAALRSRRSRAIGDLSDLETLGRWIGSRGGDLITVLPLLPTFNDGNPEPSPYAPVSRLFWSELILDIGNGAPHDAPPTALDVTRASAEVRAALAAWPAPDPASLDAELVRYARFRGAQLRLGRNWRDWPRAARDGVLDDDMIDPDEERFHLVAQLEARRQLAAVRSRLGSAGVRLGLDLAVGAHPDGYDAWSRQHMLAEGMSVGAPPDPGFPSGQDWGFPPLLPEASRHGAHDYFIAALRHQASQADVLRIDHVMALSRLYWIPHGMGLHEGTYVSYPADDFLAIVALESHRNRCEIVGENLGTVSPEVAEALDRHRIWGMYLAIYQFDDGEAVTPPADDEVALIGSHDTPTFAGWLAGIDVAERVEHGLLDGELAATTMTRRAQAADALAAHLGGDTGDRDELLALLLEWLGRSPSPLVIAWLEDLWLEQRGVNLPGTPSSARPN